MPLPCLNRTPADESIDEDGAAIAAADADDDADEAYCTPTGVLLRLLPYNNCAPAICEAVAATAALMKPPDNVVLWLGGWWTWWW